MTESFGEMTREFIRSKDKVDTVKRELEVKIASLSSLDHRMTYCDNRVTKIEEMMQVFRAEVTAERTNMFNNFTQN